MQLWNSNHSRTNFFRFFDPILCTVRKEPKTAAGVGTACLHNHAPYPNHAEVWFVKVICTLCIRSSTGFPSIFQSDFFRNNLSPSIALDVIRSLNGSYCNGNLAFDFFQFTRLNLNIPHLISTYNVLLRSLCHMCLHDLAKLVYDYMRVDGHFPDSSAIGFLVSSFVHAGKFDFAKQLLSRAQSDNIEISSFVCNNFLTHLVRRNRAQEAVSFFTEHVLKSKCYCPDTCTFNIVIRGLCIVEKVEKAFEFFDEMGSFGCSPDVATYNALINGSCRVGEADRGLDLLREVQSRKGLCPDIVTYTSVISGYCKLGNMEMALDIYDEMVCSGVKPSLVTFNVLIDGFGKTGDMPSALNIYEKMLFLGCLPDVVTFTSLIDGYCRSEKMDQGLRLWDGMRERNLAPNVYTFAILINSLCRGNRINEARDLLRQLSNREDIVPQPFIYNPVIDGLCKSGNVDEANVVVAEMEAKRCNPDKLTYTILIIGHCMKGKVLEAINIFTNMLARRCAPDRITVNSLVSCLLKAGMPNEAFRIKQAASEGLNFEISSLGRKVPFRKNIDIPVAA